MAWDPDTALVPDQFPEAVHAVALVVAQLRVDVPPRATLVGVALKVSVGAGVTTSTTTDFAAVPPAPVHAKVKVPVEDSAPDDRVPLVCRRPLHAPEAEHVVAFADVQVRLDDPPLATLVGLALKVTVGAGVAATFTMVLCVAVPPGPVQLIEKELFAARGPVDCVPLRALAPLQAPDAVQLVALVELQVRVEDPPLATLVGDAEIDADGAGAGATATVTVLLALPPRPVQVNVNPLVAVSRAVDSDPAVAFVPLHAPDATQDVARAVFHVKADVPPKLTPFGVAARSIVGGLAFRTLIVTLLVVVPPGPSQVKAKLLALSKGPVDSVPLVPFGPDHGPDARQEFASNADHRSIVGSPSSTVAEAVSKVMLGA